MLFARIHGTRKCHPKTPLAAVLPRRVGMFNNIVAYCLSLLINPTHFFFVFTIHHTISTLKLHLYYSAKSDQPVHLYDAYTGAIRATYRPYNGLDEMESPTVVTFSLDGQRILCGGLRSDRVIHIFDVAVPGRDSTVLHLGKTRRSSDGQKGLVSAIAMAPRYFCVGTYAPGSIYVYDDRTGHFSNHAILNGLCVVGHGRSHSRKKRRFVDCETSSPFVGDVTTESGGDQFIRQAKNKWFQSRTRNGVTQLMFDPNQEYLLYSASRQSDSIIAWDLRMLSDNNQEYTPVRGIASYQTASDTNQRLEFDLSDDGNTLFVGGRDRCVRIYDTKSGNLLNKLEQMDDAVNGVSFARFSNTSQTFLATASGSRRFAIDKDDSDNEDRNQMDDSPGTPPGSLRLYNISKKECIAADQPSQGDTKE